MPKYLLQNKKIKKDHQKQYQQPKNQFSKNRFYEVYGLAIIILLGIIIYSNSFTCSFNFDDIDNIVNNKSIRNLSDTNAWLSYSTNRPVSMFTFALNYHFNKLDVWYYHLFNFIIHLINTCLVWWFTLLIFSSPALKNNSIIKHKKIIAFLTALLFVSHPLATQSVTYIVQRMTSMAAMFYLLSLSFYLKARLFDIKYRYNYFWFGGSFIFAILAVFTKENAFTLPFAIILLEIFFLRTKKLQINFKDYRIILLIATFLSLIIIIPFKFNLSIFNTIPPIIGRNTVAISPSNYLLTQFSVIAKYIQLLFVPFNQNLDYDFPISNNFFNIRTLLCFLFLLSLVVLAIFLFKHNRIISFGIFWFLLTLSIESSIIPINDVIYEHRTYLPSFGFFLILSYSIFILFYQKHRYLAISIFVLIIISNSFLAHERNKVWKDDLTLWNDVVSKSPEKERPFYNRGLSYRKIGKIENAIADFTKVIEINPKNEMAYSNRGLDYGKQGQFNKAIQDFSTAIEINPKLSSAYYNRGVSYSKYSQWEMAIEDYSKVIENDPNYPMAYFNRGVAYDNLGQIEKAIADFSKSIQIDPENSVAFYNLGIAYGKIGQIEKSIVYFTKAIEFNNNYEEAYFNRGIAYERTAQWSKAIEDYSSVIKINPKYANALHNRGVIFLNLGQFEKAIADFSIALEISPKFSSAYYHRGVSYSKLGQWNKANEDYNITIEIDPDNSLAYFNRGIANEKLGLLEKAISDFTKSIIINPKYTEAFFNRGISYGEHGQLEKAVADFSRALELDPKSFLAFYNRGFTYGKFGQWNKAIADYSRVIDLNPKYPKAYCNRGIAYDNLGQFKKAIADFTKAIEIDPTYTDAKINLDVANDKLNNK